MIGPLSIRLTLGAAAPLLALLLAPSLGKASCGDYVTVMRDAPADNSPHTAPPAFPTPKPCNGPHCSQHPAAPPLAPVAPVVVVAEDWACTVSSSPSETEAAAHRQVEFAAEIPSRHPSDIFHPPR